MDDTISRQAAIDAFDGVKVDEENCTEYDIGYNDGIDFAVSRLSVLPSAQPERKTGKLIYESAYNWFRCNVCKKIYPPEFLQYFDSCQYQPGFNFCPNCGAKMEVSE